jgi:hypothetical protein
MSEELIIKGRAYLPDGPASDISPEHREWLKVQHPDAYDVLVYLEQEHAQGGEQPDNNPQPKVQPEANADLQTGPLVEDNPAVSPDGSGMEAQENNGY